MKCPNCSDSTLVMSERQGVEIDYCPQCRGIWLDRGELDKLLDRAPATAPPSTAPTGRPDFADSDFGRGGHSQNRRKKSWLHEIFD